MSSSSGEEEEYESPRGPVSKAASALSRILDATDADGAEEVLAAASVVTASTAVMEQQLSLLGDHIEGMCMECEDQKAAVRCGQCQDDFCAMCFNAQHRRGKRAEHVAHSLTGEPVPSIRKSFSAEEEEETRDVNERLKKREEKETEKEVAEDVEMGDDYGNALAALKQHYAAQTTTEIREKSGYVALDGAELSDFEERAKTIPMRLRYEERKLLRLLEATLNVSEYTDRVDQATFASPARRMYTQVLEVCGVLSGLMVATDYKQGQTLCKSREFAEYAEFFQEVLEVGRRHKIVNPEKMRTAYGKLMYLLQDTVSSEMHDLLEFSPVTQIRTVYSTLEEAGCLAMLKDRRIEVATRAITEYRMDGTKKTRPEVRREVVEKEAAVKYLARQYGSMRLPDEDLKLCLYSIGDNRSFLLSSRDPIERTIRYLTRYFRPDEAEAGYSLAISEGSEGARISHSHSRQYYYVLQSLTLWRDISNDMFKLWCHADADLLSSECSYELKDTGQGLHRVQQAPRVAKDMRKILGRLQEHVGSSWVGSSVVHLGDRNVPNALLFIDKYTQVPRILNPIVITLDRLDALAKDEKLNYYITEVFGGVEMIRKDILVDFFRFAFDGSGADSFFEAGSCIDGRLTSAWNWCSQLASKPFYPIFKLTGFQGFDGEFQN